MTKVIAFYLPQFHPIPENDKWWGEGFTEWTNVKKAKPLYNGHRQPRVPYNKNYYLLNEKSVLLWQAEMMKSYCIDGMCFYHYWFNGKQLLETPLDVLLKNPEIDMPFCLSWANEPWTRAWDGGDKEVLISQSYGDKRDWSKHFNYLLRAFKDPRYINFEGKPVFIIYRASSIENVHEMLDFWRAEAVKHGLCGIHFVKMNTVFKDRFESNGFDCSLDFEPMYTIGHDLGHASNFCRKLSVRGRSFLNRFIYKNKVPQDQLSYHMIWRRILKRQLKHDTYPGAFVDWDNTPRKADRGLVIHGGEPSSFFDYFSQQYSRCKSVDSPFIFINAWNEWAEGTYLEPDDFNEFNYLLAIKKTKSIFKNRLDDSK